MWIWSQPFPWDKLHSSHASLFIPKLWFIDKQQQNYLEGC